MRFGRFTTLLTRFLSQLPSMTSRTFTFFPLRLSAAFSLVFLSSTVTHCFTIGPLCFSRLYLLESHPCFLLLPSHTTLCRYQCPFADPTHLSPGSLSVYGPHDLCLLVVDYYESTTIISTTN